ncbi:MAG: hypothetical protein U0822_20700 [Anaerolineae bacterium]
MMKLRSLWIVTAVAAVFAVCAVAASADTGPTDIGKALALSIAPAQGTLAPGQSAWYSFVVPQEYSVQQMKRDERNGVSIAPQTITMQFNDSGNPDIAHNTGFHLYDPQGGHWVMNGIVPPTTLNAEGKAVAQTAWFTEGSPMWSGTIPDGVDTFVGVPKEWQGVLNDAGTYYVEVFNQSGEPMSYNLSITGPNLSLAPTQPSSVQSESTSSASAAGTEGAPATTSPMMSGPSNGTIGQATPLTAAPVTVSVAPGQSAWYSFVVPQEYSVQQMRRDQRNGADIGQQSIRLTFDNASNNDLAHNSGFYLYDPQRAAWLMNGIEPPTRRDENGVIIRDDNGNRQFENAYTASASPDTTGMDTKHNTDIDYFLGVPKMWHGVLNSAGTYYVQVYNNSQEPLNGTLTISGPNLSLGAQ